MSIDAHRCLRRLNQTGNHSKNEIEEGDQVEQQLHPALPRDQIHLLSAHDGRRIIKSRSAHDRSVHVAVENGKKMRLEISLQQPHRAATSDMVSGHNERTTQRSCRVTKTAGSSYR